VKAVVGATLPLSEARHAHELLAGHHVGKIVLVP
jgi:NADPH:quinone reductase-like Zn-dependent oxidoreductase